MAAEILLYDEIYPGLAQEIVSHLQRLQGEPEITVRINSPGGSVADGLAIYNAFRRHKGRVIVHIDGLAASIASLMAMGGTRVIAAENALLMIHDPWASTSGNAEELRKLADALEKHRDVMIGAYVAKSGQPEKKVRAMMARETWLTAEEALAAGFVDEIGEARQLAASFDLSKFNNAPTTRFPTMTDTTTAPKDPPKPALAAATESDILARIKARNDEIRIIFAPFVARGQYQKLYQEVLADTALTLDQVRAKLLDKMGEGSTPLGMDPDFEHRASIGYGRNDNHAEFKAAVADAMLMRHGVPVKNPHPAARDVRNMTIVDVASTLLSQRGKSSRGWSRAEVIKAALTTSDLPALMENIANKAVMTGFTESEAASQRVWTRAGELPDFKQASRVALSAAPGLEQVNERGEYKHGALSDAKESIQLATFGRIVSLSRQAIINDDLGELSRVPFALGQAAARKEASLVYGILTANPDMRDGNALFDATHGNVGTTGALSVTTLGEARKLMRVQKGLDGESELNIVPRYLIVPAALETVAEQIMAQLQPAESQNAVPEWIRRLMVVVDARLDSASETAFYLAASPEQHDTIEIARLDGQGAEVLTENGFNVDEVKFKVRLDVGAAALDWRGLVYNAGA